MTAQQLIANVYVTAKYLMMGDWGVHYIATTSAKTAECWPGRFGPERRSRISPHVGHDRRFGEQRLQGDVYPFLQDHVQMQHDRGQTQRRFRRAQARDRRGQGLACMGDDAPDAAVGLGPARGSRAGRYQLFVLSRQLEPRGQLEMDHDAVRRGCCRASLEERTGRPESHRAAAGRPKPATLTRARGTCGRTIMPTPRSNWPR